MPPGNAVGAKRRARARRTAGVALPAVLVVLGIVMLPASRAVGVVFVVAGVAAALGAIALAIAERRG